MSLRRAYTLTEIAAVLGIGALVLGSSVNLLLPFGERRARAQAESELGQLCTLLDEHHRETGSLPTDCAALAARAAGEFAVDAFGRPLDPWGQPYAVVATASPLHGVLVSGGPDGELGPLPTLPLPASYREKPACADNLVCEW